jgi:hypothetical protein
VGENPQGEVEEAGGVGLLGGAEGDLDIGCGAGRQGDPSARPASSLLAAAQCGEQRDDADGQQARAGEPGDDPRQLP